MGVQRGRRGAIRRVLGVCWVLGSMSQQRILSSPRAGPKRYKELLLPGVRGCPSVPYLFSPQDWGPRGLTLWPW
jgi:hypothetical protein